MNLDWMAWTLPTGVFFASILTVLVIMTLLAIYRPETARVGLLGIETTRGDRLFLTLLGSAFIHLAWLALVGEPLWAASLVSLAYAGIVFRWV
jgi:predicted small integral membrane protein